MRRRMRTRLPGLLLLAATLLLGCLRVPSLDDCPGALVSTDAIEGAFLLHQDIRLRSARLDVGIRLIVQKKAARLVLVGFNTLGFKVFTVVQEGTATTVDAPLGPAWGVPPLNVLHDLHRTRFRRVPGGPFPDGEVRGAHAGVSILEQWQDGALVTRSFARSDDETGTRVRVTFAGDTATVVHPRCGYEATIVTTEERPL